MVKYNAGIVIPIDSINNMADINTKAMEVIHKYSPTNKGEMTDVKMSDADIEFYKNKYGVDTIEELHEKFKGEWTYDTIIKEDGLYVLREWNYDKKFNYCRIKNWMKVAEGLTFNKINSLVVEGKWFDQNESNFMMFNGAIPIEEYNDILVTFECTI